MKTIKILSIAFIILMGLSSCEKWIREDINVDPNNPTDVKMAQLLPAVQAGYAYILGGDMGRYTSLWTQHHAGVDRQHAGFDIYQFTESETNNNWNSVYQSVMMELNIMKVKAGGENPYYLGIYQTMMSLVILQISDLHGNVPFSDAFLGSEGVMDPTFDSQESIYDDCLALLASAHNNFMAAPEDNVELPGADDLMFGGDVAKWMSLSHAVAARTHLHLGKISSSNYQMALDELDMGALTSNADNATVPFYDNATNSNPLYQFMDQRGDIAMGKTLVDIMNANADPRRQAIAGDPIDGTWSGSGAGEFNTAVNRPGPYYASINSPVHLMTYAEVKFIEAEAAFQAGDLGRAATAHNDAVLASLEMYGASGDAAFEAAHAAFDSGSITLEEIMTQKYVHMYTNPESFSDWRRTNIPALSPADGALQPDIPRIWPHAQDERLYNSNFPGPVLLTDRVWWDVE